MAGKAHPTLGPDAEPFLWMLDEARRGRKGALLTITALHGGAPRPVGTHMAVVSGRRFTGYLSGGGCVESAIATEFEPIIAAGRDKVLRFGKGSSIYDIRFPCGGGIDVLAHIGPRAELLEEALDLMAERRAFALALSPGQNGASIDPAAPPTGWSDGLFQRRYLPRTRLCLAGMGPELEAVARMALAAQFEVVAATPDPSTARRLALAGVSVQRLSSTTQAWTRRDDAWTATVLLFHEREWEEPLLQSALAGPGFYIGALGSARTQAMRRERLLATGCSPADIARIHGPIGLIPSARDPDTLALSVLAEIAAHRRMIDQALA